jgi:sec-independent protein translocase protein TatA
MGELVIILLIVLVVFGANKLPGIGDALGRSIKNFKRASKVDGDKDEDDEKDEKDTKSAKQLPAKQSKQLDKGSSDDDGEWEEVVVRRRKKSVAE